MPLLDKLNFRLFAIHFVAFATKCTKKLFGLLLTKKVEVDKKLVGKRKKF